MAAADSPASSRSSNRAFRVSFKSQDIVTSSPVPSAKTGRHKNGSEKSQKPAEITPDLCSGNLNATSIAAPPAGAPSAVTQAPCPTNVPTATKESPRINGLPRRWPVSTPPTPAAKPKRAANPPFFSVHGASPRVPMRRGLGGGSYKIITPLSPILPRRSALLSREKAIRDSSDEPRPSMGLRDQRKRQKRAGLALWNAGGFGNRAAAFRKHAAALKASAVQPPLTPATAAPSTPKGVAPAPTREEFRDRMTNCRRNAEKLKAQLLARLG
ncbi:hypothetical protein C7212DRAFT_346148 [Tuber magnatum]|uniref:Uncharacterized protein n=1 Tax=Tuber magnatum TaxID=42249 RepID=A0A317SKC9_9PEZI|nr:hypothetical protein C7212DRAFT_346148 [Tuber magnatum]